jgi:hypothetical protein
MMTLGNMRENGMQTLSVSCLRCHHQSTLDVDRYSDDMTVPSFGPRMACTACGAIDADARPYWNERAQACLFGRSGS